jgi:DNA-binding MarR family transcriptional regulator
VPESSGEIDDASVIRRGVNRLDRRLRSEGPPDGLALGKLSILGHLTRAAEAMTPTELAAADRLQPQSLTRVLADLERDGLVARRHDGSDGRRFQITITAAGRSALRRDMRQRDAWLAQGMMQLSPTERGVLRLAGELMDGLADAPAVETAASESVS